MFACGQVNVSTIAPATQQENLVYDTDKIAILPIGTIGTLIFGKATTLQLTNDNLKTIDSLLNICINENNSRQDTSNRFSEYINLHKYRLQYMAIVDSTGDKKVYVNGFCYTKGDTSFDYWRKNLVEVDDGGSCFFHLTINLSREEYEHLFTNGYA